MEITDIHHPWRDALRPASFRGAGFFVQVGSRGGGRRTVLHEYPKRDDPYAEDMGRRAKEFPVLGYLLGNNYLTQRDALEVALDAEGPGLLVLPTRSDIQVQCVRFVTTEREQYGGYCEIEMTFVEAGRAGNSTNIPSTPQQISNSGNTANDAALNTLSSAPFGSSSVVFGGGG